MITSGRARGVAGVVASGATATGTDVDVRGTGVAMTVGSVAAMANVPPTSAAMALALTTTVVRRGMPQRYEAAHVANMKAEMALATTSVDGTHR